MNKIFHKICRCSHLLISLSQSALTADGIFSVKTDDSPVSTRRCFDVYTTSITLKRRRMDVKTTLCAYWDGVDRKIGKLLDILEVMVKPEWKSKRSTSKEIEPGP